MAVRRSSASASPRWLNCGLAALFLFISVPAAVACPLCYEVARQVVTIGQQLDMADQVVLAVPLAGAKFRIVEIVKGNNAVGDVIADQVTGLDTAAAADGDPYLLIRDAAALQWTSVGTIRADYADWLRQLVATIRVKGDRPRPTWPMNRQTSLTLSYDGWRQRIALVLPYLENSDPLAARIAWGELARAPYVTMDVARSRIDATAVESWLDNPKLVSRHAAYTLLLGFAGSADDVARIEQRIEAAWNAHDSTNLAAMIGADLELRGPSRVELGRDEVFCRSYTHDARNRGRLACAQCSWRCESYCVPRACDPSVSDFHQGAPTYGRLRGHAVGRLELLGRHDGLHGAPQVQRDQGSGFGICRRQLSTAFRGRQGGCSIDRRPYGTAAARKIPTGPGTAGAVLEWVTKSGRSSRPSCAGGCANLFSIFFLPAR